MRTKWTEEQLIKAVKSSFTIAEVLRKIGLQVRAGNYETFHRYCKKLKLDSSHFTGQKCGRGGKRKTLLSEILVKDSSYPRGHLKDRLLKKGLLKNKCSICGIEKWKGKFLVMILDHINGINNDNRLKNLRMLCPNCNSQQDTFCGKNKSY